MRSSFTWWLRWTHVSQRRQAYYNCSNSYRCVISSRDSYHPRMPCRSLFIYLFPEFRMQPYNSKSREHNRPMFTAYTHTHTPHTLTHQNIVYISLWQYWKIYRTWSVKCGPTTALNPAGTLRTSTWRFQSHQNNTRLITTLFVVSVTCSQNEGHELFLPLKQRWKSTHRANE